MFKREETKKIKVGNITIGGSSNVLIQSMCNVKTSKITRVIKQINECAELGADLMRLSILDERDADAIKYIKQYVNIPLIADIHFDYHLAIKAIENGIDAIRINPGNIGGEENLKKVIDVCKKYHIPVRIGVNSGSMDKDVYQYDSKLEAFHMIESVEKFINLFEKYNYTNIVISLKSSDLKTTVEAYKLFSEKYNYPLHVGLTEASIKDISLIRSSAALSLILSSGIGDTIRISITDKPREEVIAAKRLLHDLGLYDDYYTLVSCPTCGRTQVNVKKITLQIQDYLEKNPKKIHVAIMGCIVNGPGEAKNADLGLAGGRHHFALFKKGKVIKTISEKEVLNELKSEIDKF